MMRILKPALFLLTAAVILLVSDLGNRIGSFRDSEVTRIAIFKISSSQILEEAENGVLEVLKNSEPYINGKIEIKRYNAEGDMPVANTIARTIVSDRFNMVITISTPALQVMANANKDGELLHLFCGVTDPFASGVGITGPEADQHPAHLVGIGTFQPVEEVFRIAKEMKPDLKRVGVAWCASETCSEACVRKARSICRELGIELVESSIETGSQVYEAALALASKGVDALWIGGDNVVEPAIDMYIAAASKSDIPVFTNNPKHSLRGAVASLGANYFQVGQTAGKMAVSLLNGQAATSFGTKNMVPERLFLNDSVRASVKGNWIITSELAGKADTIVRAGTSAPK